MAGLSNVFSSPYRQEQRLLRLSFPQGDLPSATDAYGRRSTPTIVVEHLHAKEGMSADFEIELLLLADSAHIALKDMMAKLLAVSLTKPDGELRWFTGFVTEFSLVDAEAGVASYRAILRPWLWFTTLRTNNRVFREQSIQQQTDTILQDYGPLPRWQWGVQGTDAPFTMAVQGAGIGESDHAYLHRRWEKAGYSYHYEHAQDGHTFVASDDSTRARPIDSGTAEVRFQAKGGPDEEDSIRQWSDVRQAVTALTAASAFNFKAPVPRNNQISTTNRQGAVPALEVHDYAGAYGFRKEDASGDALVRLRMEEIETGAKHYEGEGNNHSLQPGRWFQLTDHFSCQDKAQHDNQYLITHIEHWASNNYRQKEGARSEYRNRFAASRLSVPWRPGLGFNSQPLQVLAPQTATVVGNGGAGALDIDEYGRILIRYHWDREGKYSARVRVSSNWAGGETGMVSWPRVGSEVIVQCLDGDADHPLITGVVYNQTHMPPWTVPGQKALTGLRSRELAGDGGNQPGGRSNHLILDDSAGQIQAKVRSDEQASELSLGHIVRIDSTQGRKHQGGQGAELRTDGHGAVRAAKGLLVTTETRTNAQAHMTDMRETTIRLEDAQSQHQTLSQGAQQAQAQDAGDQEAVAKVLQQQNEQLKGNSGGNKAEGQFPEFEQPHLLIASPAGIEATTPGSTHLASGEHIALTSAKHTSVAAAQSVLVSAKDAVRMVAFEQGIRIVSAQADIEINALKDTIKIRAKRNVEIEGEDISLTARNNIHIAAKNQVTVNGGTSYTTWTGSGIEHATNGVHREWAASHSLVGPKSQPVPGTAALPGAKVLCEDCMLKALKSGSAMAAV